MERIPKNIRQIGGREERVKTYLEDYVSTYLRKLQEEREENGAAGRRQSPLCVCKRRGGDERCGYGGRPALRDGGGLAERL